MRTLVVLALLIVPFSTFVQASEKPSPDAQWQAVQNLKPGSSIRVTTASSKQDCSFHAADAETLSCSEKDKEFTFTRSEIRLVIAGHRGRSALTGALLGGAVGAGIGAGTDFTHKTIYKAP